MTTNAPYCSGLQEAAAWRSHASSSDFISGMFYLPAPMLHAVRNLKAYAAPRRLYPALLLGKDTELMYSVQHGQRCSVSAGRDVAVHSLLDNMSLFTSALWLPSDTMTLRICRMMKSRSG